jgi:hypothetical protein
MRGARRAEILLAAVAILALGCSTPAPTSAPAVASVSAPPAAATSAAPTPPREPPPIAESPFAPAAPAPSAMPKPFRTDTGDEGEVLLAFGYEGGLGVTIACIATGKPAGLASASPMGRVRPFTLYESGAVIFVRKRSFDVLDDVRRAELGKDGAARLMKEIVGIGLDRIDSRPKRCDPAVAPRSCMTDAATTVVEARLPSGNRIEVRNYAGVAVAQRALDAVLARIERFDHPDALPYVPTTAALFTEICTPEDAADMRSRLGVVFAPWPLDRALLARPEPDALGWGARVPGTAYATFYGDGTPLGSVRAWMLDGIDYASFLVPILPGGDFTVVTGFRRRAPSVR